MASNHNSVWLAVAGMVRELRGANREQVEDAITGLKQGAKDFSIAATDREIYKKLLPIFRKQLKDYGPRKKNPAKKKTRKKNPKKPDYIIAAVDRANNVMFLHATNQWTERKNAVRFTSQAFAKRIAQTAANSKSMTVGVVPENMLSTKIRAEFKRGKA